MLRIVAATSLVLVSWAVLADDKGDCQDSKDHDLRIKDCSAIILRNPKDVVAYHNRGDAYGLKGDIDRAISDYNKAIELNPNYAPAYNSRGRAYTSKGDYTRAVADVTRAGELTPKLVPKPGPLSKGAAHKSNTPKPGLVARKPGLLPPAGMVAPQNQQWPSPGWLLPSRRHYKQPERRHLTNRMINPKRVSLSPARHPPLSRRGLKASSKTRMVGFRMMDVACADGRFTSPQHARGIRSALGDQRLLADPRPAGDGAELLEGLVLPGRDGFAVLPAGCHVGLGTVFVLPRQPTTAPARQGGTNAGGLALVPGQGAEDRQPSLEQVERRAHRSSGGPRLRPAGERHVSHAKFARLARCRKHRAAEPFGIWIVNSPRATSDLRRCARPRPCPTPPRSARERRRRTKPH